MSVLEGVSVLINLELSLQCDSAEGPREIRLNHSLHFSIQFGNRKPYRFEGHSEGFLAKQQTSGFSS